MADVTLGQRFRDVQRTMFGHAPPDWVVERVFSGVDGNQYAQVYRAADPKERKTLSTAILLDKSRFIEVQQR